MSCPARLGAFAAVSLVLLRLAIGWHFFQEGTNKLNDPTWSSAGFLLQAKGPLADFYHSKVPQAHDWRTLLAVPREAGYIDQERLEEHRQWQEAYAKEIEAAREAGEPVPFKVSQFKPYAQWADRIFADWQETLEQFFELPEIHDAEMEQASEALADARQQLVNYLDAVEPEISEFQHEMFRIEQMEKQRVTGGPAYQDERIRAKEVEAAQMAQPWLAEVEAIEEEYHDRLRAIYRAGQEAREAERSAAQQAAAAEAGVVDQTAEPEAQTAASADEAVNAEASENVPTEVADEPATDREGLPPGPEEPVAESDSAEREVPQVLDEIADANGDPSPAAVADADSTEPAEQSPEEAEAEAEAEATADAATAEEVPEDAEAAAEEDRLTVQDVLTDTKQADLALVDKVVTWSHVIIGALLVVGLFTPIAALGGAIFLAMVISTQPPWVAGTQDTYYQFVEMFGLLVLAATCAGRWAGLDYFFACLFGKCRRS